MKCHVLIAEDEEVLADLLREIFEDHGCKVVSFATADAAYDYLQSTGQRLDLLFTDVKMPGKMTGLDLAYHARRLQPDLRIVISSGYFDGPTQQLSRVTLLPKPWEIEQLLQACDLRD